jgi:branched-chain amino acid aminotransferase
MPLREVRLSPGQAGLFNGWGLFTTIRIYGGQPFAFDRHWRRLRADAERTDTPFGFAAAEILEALQRVVIANGALESCGRLYFTYNTTGLWHSDEPFPTTDVLICTADVAAHHRPARLTVQPNGRHAAHPLAGTKVLAWLPNNWIAARARRAGFDEAVLLNERDEVSECTSANLFIVKEGVVETPPLSSGCLGGITREILIELGTVADFPVRESVLTMDDVHSADELFITSTSREVLPVSHVEDRRVALVDGPATSSIALVLSDYITNAMTSADPRAEV